MPFFARPNLTDEQFKQLKGDNEILTLSGQTRIATTSGLTLSDGAGGYVTWEMVTNGIRWGINSLMVKLTLTLWKPFSTRH